MHQVTIGNWSMEIQVGDRPLHFDGLVERSRLADDLDLTSGPGRTLFLAVYGPGNSKLETSEPTVALAMRYEPYDFGFYPGFLIVPETSMLFVGAGTRLIAYDLNAPTRLWTDEANCGFWRWGRNRDHIWMEAELEFAVWSSAGEKLWTTFVEPPWFAQVNGEEVVLDVMGVKRTHRMTDGKEIR